MSCICIRCIRSAQLTGTTIKRTVVDWESNRFVAFAALLCCLRHCGARKADRIPVKSDEFDGRHNDGPQPPQVGNR